MLETKIDKLTKQLEILNGHAAAYFANATPVVQAEEVAQVVTDVATEIEIAIADAKKETPAITHRDIRDLCLIKVRENRTVNKTKVKAILTDFGASIVEELPLESLAEVQNLIGAL